MELSESGDTQAVARHYNISKQTLYNWKSDLKRKNKKFESKQIQDNRHFQELLRLKEENAKLKERVRLLRDIVKKNGSDTAGRKKLAKEYTRKGVCPLLSVNEILEETGLKRSTFFDFLSSNKGACFKRKVLRKRVPRKPEEDKRIRDWIKDKREGEIFFDTGGGYKALCKYAERDVSLNVSSVNHKRMYSICKENNLLLYMKQKRKRAGHRAYENRVISAPPLIFLLSTSLFLRNVPIRMLT